MNIPVKSPAVDATDGSQIAPATYLKRIYESGGQGFFDAVGIHPYSFPARPIDPSTSAWNTFHRTFLLYDLMLRNGDGDKKVWFTEFGAATGTGLSAVSEPEQAAIVTDSFPVHERGRTLGTIGAVVGHAVANGYATVEVTAEAEEDWIQRLLGGGPPLGGLGNSGRSLHIPGSLECTPGYYNNEGQPPTAASRYNFLGFPGGPLAFFQYIDRWRRSGEFEGLEFR